jgi:hypothetical protein
MLELLENDRANYETFRLSLTDYNKARINRRELRLGGKMFDVKSVDFIADSVQVVAINDKAEEQIIENIVRQVLGIHDQSKNALNPNLQKLISLQYIPAIGENEQQESVGRLILFEAIHISAKEYYPNKIPRPPESELRTI